MTNLHLSVAMKYGLMLAGISLLLGLIGTFILNTDNTTQSLTAFNILNIIIFWLAVIIFLGLAHLEFNKKNGDYISFGDAIIIGLVVLGISFVISTTYNYINYEFLIKEKLQHRVGNSYSVLYLILGSFLYLLLQIVILFALITFESHWKIFRKAGKKGWASIIPFYNTIVLLDIVKKPAWWLILLFIPIVNIVFAIWITNLLSKSFGKDEGFTVGLILLPFVFYPLLGLSRTEFIKDYETGPVHP